MSLTNTQVIERTVQQPNSEMSSRSRRFLLPAEGMDDDKGLVLRLDSASDSNTSITSKNAGSSSTGARTATGSTPVPAKLCGQSKAVAQWALFTWVLHVHKVSEWAQKLLIRLLPIFLYVSLLVGAIQAVGVIYLLTSSFLPLGAYFLLACIGTMGYIYVSTVPLQRVSSPRRSMSPCMSPATSHLHLN